MSNLLYMTENYSYAVRYGTLDGTYDIVEIDRHERSDRWKAVANRDWRHDAIEYADKLESGK